MWIQSDGKIISSPRSILVGGTKYPASIFYRWSKEELHTLGIKPFREKPYDNRYYISTGTEDVELDGEIVRQHTTANKYTNLALRGIVVKRLKKSLFRYLVVARQELDYLNEFEPSNVPLNVEWVGYIAQLKMAAQNIRNAIQAIQSYDEGVEFIRSTYQTMLPEVPVEE